MNMEFELLLRGLFYPSTNLFWLPSRFSLIPYLEFVVHAFVVLVEQFLEWKWGLILLDKPSVCRILPDIAIGMDFFSTPPELHWKGSHGLRDCAA